MEALDENISHRKKDEMEDAVFEESVKIKVPRARIRLKSRELTMSKNIERSLTESPISKIMIRHSADSPSNQQSNYEIITKSRSSRDEIAPQLLPTVQIERYEVPPAESPQEKALNNGLDPIGIELISSTSMASSKAESEYSDKSEDLHGSMRMNREMKNLQKSTNDSKILSDYLSSSNESPRSRSRKNKDVPLADPDELEEEPSLETSEVVIKDSPASHREGNESDATEIILTMEPPEQRRKSVPRSRNRSQSAVRGRQKSVARQMQDEVTSDKEEAQDDEDDDQASETSTAASRRSIEGRPVNPPPKPGWDSFCFKCHTDTAVLSLACSRCKCSYHRHCVRTNPIPKNVEEFECPECREVEAAELSAYNKYGHEKIDANTLADMLTIILEKIRTYPDRENFESDIVVKERKDSSLPLIVTQMSLKTLEARIKTHSYKVTEAFIHDIKQLEHNWNIVDRSKTKTLKTIVKYVNTEINELEACVYCYENSFITGDWFVQPCKRPHLLIWAKLKGYPYWPAKVMSIDSRQHVDVRFFGAHDRAWVPTAHCILFCEKDPNKTKGTVPSKTTNKTQKGIADAMKEKDDYIVKLRDVYGFKYAPFKQQLEANDLQNQLQFMLPGLNASKDAKEGLNGGAEREIDGAQKEKLTLKIIKGQSSNYKVEHKTTEQRVPQSHKDKPKLYRVLSKNDNNADMEQPRKLQPLIIKRKSIVEQEIERSKKQKTTNDAASETSESSASVQSGMTNNSRRKSARGTPKHKKPVKVPEKESVSEPPAKKARRHSEKQKAAKEDSEPEEETRVEKPKPSKKSRAKSVLPECDKPLLVPLVVPPGTDEIEELRSESPLVPIVVKHPNKKHHRSQSVEKEPKTPLKTVNNNTQAERPQMRRSLSEVTSRKSLAENQLKPADETPQEKPVEESGFDPHLVIKDEPMSDNEQEEEIQEDAYTLSDIPNLINDKSGKKKVIVISTNEGGETSSSAASSQQSARARKTFPNQATQLQMDSLSQQQNRNGNWMICIPQVFTPAATQASTMQSPPTSNRSTPASDSQGSVSHVRSNNSARNSLNSQQSSNRPMNSNIPPPSYSFSNNSSRRNSINSNPVYINGQRVSIQSSNVAQQRSQNQDSLPRLVPRPQGVFSSDGTTFNRDVGPVSRMFTDNAHRMSDFFRNILMESVSAFAPEVPTAENLMLRAENEKLQREIQLTKADCQLKMQEVKSDCQVKMQELRREHQDEIETVKKELDERQKKIQMAFEQEKNKIIHEIRQQSEIEKQRAIEITRKETKKNTWCSNCPKEARFYCCWNTSYCGPQCQKSHWQIHQRGCSNKNSAIETPPVQQPVSKQINPESVVLNVNPNRQALVLRAPQQMQQLPVIPPPQSQPVSIQQHIILTTAAPSGMTTGLNPNMPNQQILIGTYQSKNRPIHSIFHDSTTRDPLTSTVNVKTIQRNDSPNLSVISTQPMTESMLSTPIQE